MNSDILSDAKLHFSPLQAPPGKEPTESVLEGAAFSTAEIPGYGTFKIYLPDLSAPTDRVHVAH